MATLPVRPRPGQPAWPGWEPLPSHAGVQNKLRDCRQPHGEEGTEHGCASQWVLESTLEHPHQTWTWLAEAVLLQLTCPLLALRCSPLTPVPGWGFSVPVFMHFPCSRLWQGADELRAASAGGALCRQPPNITHSPKHCGFLW